MGLGDEPFIDEYAYITQSYQPDLVVAGRTNDPEWLEFQAYDLVPLPKYFINAAFRLAGIPRPGRGAALAWYRNRYYQWGSRQDLVVARLPSVLMGAIGCVGIYLLGALVKDGPTGWIAAILLAVNPLYRLHAHRAMSEAPCEAFLLLSLALGLWAWVALLGNRSVAAGGTTLIVSGVLAGLSILAKFTGVMATLAVVAWVILGLALPRVAAARKLILAAGAGAAVAAAWCMFVALNPFMTARPESRTHPELKTAAESGTVQRLAFLVRHRRVVMRLHQEVFSQNALFTVTERARVLAVQGFGRFGPLGPRTSDASRRYDLSQDWGVFLWLPLVATGLGWSIRLGSQQLQIAQPPAGWALALWACLAIAVVTAYLPLAWDRYQMPVQAPAALLAAIPLGRAWTAARTRVIGPEVRP
jgi:4-amino-4-deoxy-L-arabinose transferase-like glycosyltransferase